MRYKILVINDSDQEILFDDVLHRQFEIRSIPLCDIQESPIDLNLAFLVLAINKNSQGEAFVEAFKNFPLLAGLPILVIGPFDMELAKRYINCGVMDYILDTLDAKKVSEHIMSLYQYHYKKTHHHYKRDELTNVFKKEYFIDEVSRRLNEDPHNEYDIICFDVDRFKMINDKYGSQKGDDLLSHIAHHYENLLASDKGIVSRLYNDVFALFVKRSDEIYNCIIDSTKEINKVIPDIKLVIRFGVYQICDTSVPIGVMCDRAMIAMDERNQHYKSSYSIYEDRMRQNILDEQTVLNQLDQAMVKKEFKPFYQPKYNMETGEITGFEALMRWLHPTQGLIPPNEFIPIFEKNKLISRVDELLWEQVCQDLSQLIQKGCRALPVSINVSREELYLDIKTKLLSLLDEYKVPVSLLQLEITETAYTQDPKQLITIINELRHAGFVVHMDDFGSGYSSLNMLKDIEIDILKLDLRFLENIQSSNKSKTILESVVSMAKQLELQTIAEGVETKEQVQYLKSVGCLNAQGYYYSKPISQDKMFELYMQKENK